VTIRSHRQARELGRKGGLAKAARHREATAVPAPFVGTMLDMMDAAGLVGPTWDAWRTFWCAVFGLPMSEKADLATFARHTGRQAPPAAPVREAWLIVGRRGGKSRSAALAALFLGIRRDWARILAPGERAVCPVIAADRHQARATLSYLKGLLALPAFERYKARVLKDHVELTTGAEIRVSTASYRTTRGYTLIGVVAEEVAFWLNDETGANPDSEVLGALRPGMATVPGALLLGLSSPYAAKGELYKAHVRYAGTDDPGGLAWNADTLSMNPLVDQAVIAQAFADDPIAAASEYGQDGSVSFRRDVQNLFDPEAVRAVMVRDRRELPPVETVRYVAFVDPAGGSGGDSFTLAIAHRDGERVVLDAVRETQPSFSPESVVADYAALLRRYRLYGVTGDCYAGDWPRERFAAHGIGYGRSELTRSDVYRELLPLLNAGRLELLDWPRLAAQFVGLERHVSRSGKDSIDHTPGGHDDLANAAAGALVRAATRTYVFDALPLVPRRHRKSVADEMTTNSSPAEPKAISRAPTMPWVW